MPPFCAKLSSNCAETIFTTQQSDRFAPRRDGCGEVPYHILYIEFDAQRLYLKGSLS